MRESKGERMESVLKTLDNHQLHSEPKGPDAVPHSAQIAEALIPTFGDCDLPLNGLLEPAELEDLRRLNKMIEQAREFIPFLYTYRSLYKALNKSEAYKAASQNTNDPKYARLNEEYINVFKPRCDQLLKLYECVDSSITLISTLARSGTYQAGSAIYDRLMELFEILFNLDALKSRKTGITTDMSIYNRIVGKDQIPEDQQQKFFELRSYLPRGDFTCSKLKEEFQNNDNKKATFNYFVRFLKHVIDAYNQRPLTPQRYSQIIISIVCIMQVHSLKEQDFSILSDKIAKDALQIIQANPIGILEGDNSFLPGTLIASIPGFTAPKGITLITEQKALKAKADELAIKNQIHNFSTIYNQSLQTLEGLNITSIDLIVELIDNLSRMTLAIILESKFKLSCPAKKEEGSNASIYDLAVKLNYTEEDLNALIELIGYIKVITGKLLSLSPQLSEYIQKYITHEIHELAMNTLEGPYITIHSKGDDRSKSALEMIRIIFGAWGDVDMNTNIPKDAKKAQRRTIKDSYAGYSVYQIDVLRSQLDQICRADSPFIKGKSSCLDKNAVTALNEFSSRLSVFEQLLNFSALVRNCSNLGCLWFKETYIDMDGVLQYPVRSSLPFILGEHLLRITDRVELHDFFFYPLELYNDAASLAVQRYHSRYLYNEIDAEVRLCIEMITILFADTFYQINREQAAGIELPPIHLGKIRPQPTRYSVVVLQNRFEILGSIIDFNGTVTQKLNGRIKKELEICLDMLTDLRAIPYICDLLRIIRTTHKLLVKAGLRLDPIESLWASVNGSENPLVVETRLVSKLRSCLDLGKFQFDAGAFKFTSQKELKLQPITNEQWAAVFVEIHEEDTTVLTIKHLECLVNFLTPVEFAVFYEGYLPSILDTLGAFFKNYVEVAPALRLLPNGREDDLSRFFTFCRDAYGTFSHPSLPRLLGAMRMFGNMIAFLYMVEQKLPLTNEDLSFLPRLMDLIKGSIMENIELFAIGTPLDIETTMTHRLFSSLWSIIEFVYCSSDPVNLTGVEGEEKVIPIERFGDGPIITAHILSIITGQDEIYQFDSVCTRLYEMASCQTKSADNSLCKFLENVEEQQKAHDMAKLIAYPFRLIQIK